MHRAKIDAKSFCFFKSTGKTPKRCKYEACVIFCITNGKTRITPAVSRVTRSFRFITFVIQRMTTVLQYSTDLIETEIFKRGDSYAESIY